MLADQNIVIEKWDALEERITRLVDTAKSLKEKNSHLLNELNQQTLELQAKAELLDQLQQQNQQFAQVKDEHDRFLQEREEVCRRLEGMLSELEQVHIETA